MHIQSYQIHNVLNVYRRQLSQGKNGSPQTSPVTSAQTDRVTLSNQGANHAIMEKVAASVIEKITRFTPVLERDGKPAVDVDKKTRNPTGPDLEDAFTFNTIVNENRKETRSIEISNSHAFMSRLDELAKAAVSRNTE